MCWVKVDPITPEAEVRMIKLRDTIRSLIRSHLGEVWGIGEEDKIVNLQRCIVIDPDPVAIQLGVLPDVVIRFHTNDPFQNLAESINKSIVAAWNEQIGDQLRAEAWFTFFHTWGCTFGIG